MNKSIILLIILVAVAQVSVAQRRKAARKSKPAAASSNVGSRPPADTSRPRTVVVTSAFKPSLRNASKINFSAAAPTPDSGRPSLQYDVPSQNLFFSYQPTALKPLAATIDTAIHWENTNYIKAGYGNYSSPYLQAGLSLGDGVQQAVNVNFKHTSAKGKLPFQQYSNTNLEVIGIFNKGEQTEWDGKLFFNNNTQYEYGYQPDSLQFSKDDLRQRFTAFGGKIGFRNKKENDYGISYHPTMAIDAFTDNHNGRESNFVLNAPLSKSFGKNIVFNLALNADLTNYKSDSAQVNNNLFSLAPSLQYQSGNVKLNAGILPSWDNSAFSMLPDFTAEAKVNEEQFIVQAGWVGYYNKTNYKTLAGLNPWLQQPSFLLNTRIKELYAGFKGSAGDHITYNARLSFLQINNQPLFVNDTITGRSFQVINEPSLKDIRLHTELGYTVQENFSLLAGASYNRYSNLQVNDKAYGLLPLEINGSLRWAFLKNVLLKSDLYFWDGPRYRNKTLGTQKLKPAADLNAGLEFSVLPKAKLWVQFNNLFNNQYQRWNQYPVLGFNVLAGFVYSFGQSGK